MNASPPMPAAQSATDYARFESPDGTCVWVDPARAEIVAIAYVDGPVPDYSPAQARALARIVARLNDNVLLNVDLRASGTFRLCEVSGTLFMERRLPARPASVEHVLAELSALQQAAHLWGRLRPLHKMFLIER